MPLVKIKLTRYLDVFEMHYRLVKKAKPRGFAHKKFTPTRPLSYIPPV